MTKISFSLVTALILIMSVKPAFAQYGRSGKAPVKMRSGSGSSGTLFDVGVYYGKSEAKANPSVSNEWEHTTSIYDIKLGIVSESSFYYGLLYSTRSDNQASLNSASGNGLGAGLGYFFESGANIRAFYRFNESFENYSQGSGFQVDGMFMANPTSNFYIGAGITHRQTTYKKNSVITNFDYWSRIETYPFISLGFLIN